MKTYEIQKYGGPEGLELVDRPLPEPGDHDVVVQIRAASLNYRDLVVIRGKYDRNPREGRVPLSDGAGEVVSVGSAVTRVKVGDRVAGCFLQGWSSGRFEAAMHRTALGGLIDGVLAEQVKFLEEGVVHLPEGYSFEEGSDPAVRRGYSLAIINCAREYMGNGYHFGKVVIRVGE